MFSSKGRTGWRLNAPKAQSSSIQLCPAGHLPGAHVVPMESVRVATDEHRRPEDHLDWNWNWAGWVDEDGCSVRKCQLKLFKRQKEQWCNP